MIKNILVIGMTASALLRGATQTETDLRAELAQTKAALAAAQKDRAKETAAVNAMAAQDAVTNAVIAARLQGDALARGSSQNDLATRAIYATLITSVFGFLSLLASFGWKAFTDNRDHRWLVESTHRAELATAEHRATELAKIAEVQQSAKAAYTEANTVNRKIASIGLKMANDQPLKPDDPSSE